jgi:hypothetical protein
MSQLIRLRKKYLDLPVSARENEFDWTLGSIKKRFREEGLSFNETTFGISGKVKGSVMEGTDITFDCVLFSKDMVRDFQIARHAVNGDFRALQEQSFFYEKAFIEDLIDEVCDINTLTDGYYKELIRIEPRIKE